ncbi:MFS transporter [Dickeya zeae]|uniref:MFS transporter n=1 Tax=Dickeya zeae TaxID=204042 RepID=UPI00143FF22D|nr:MFS transporter [Dickeya zeae]QIZ46161.1 MFS transporter [Dickeya zeae]
MNASFIWHDKPSLNYLVSLFIFSLGSYIINPYYAIYVSDNLGYGIAFAGFLVSAKVISQRIFALVGGSIADILPTVYAAQIGVTIRALSFALLALDARKEFLVVSAVMNGIGGALFNPAIRKLLFTRYKDHERRLKAVIGWRNAAFNMGAAIGPLIGIYLINLNFKGACVAITLIHIIVGLMLISRTQNAHLSSAASKNSLLEGVTACITNRALYPVFALQFFFMYFYSNIEYLLPIFIARHFNEYFVSMVFFVNTVFIIAAQTVFGRFFNELRVGVAWCSLLVFFITLSVLSFYSIASPLFYGSLIVIAVAAFSAAEVILSIQVDYIAMQTGGNHNNSGTVFGAISLVAAGGLFAANTLNSLLLNHYSFLTVWLINTAFIAILGIYTLCISRADKAPALSR